MHELHAKEPTLREDLSLMRDAIGHYTKDKEEAPQDLDALVTSGYLRQIPTDPFTESNETWQVVLADPNPAGRKHKLGITDVHSGSMLISSKGTPYNSW